MLIMLDKECQKNAYLPYTPYQADNEINAKPCKAPEINAPQTCNECVDVMKDFYIWSPDRSQ
jgi:hypothetical protein